MNFRDHLPDYLREFYDAGDRACVRALMLGEAENQGRIGQLMVGWVLIWRLTHARTRQYTYLFSPVDLRENALARGPGFAEAQFSCFSGDGWARRHVTMQRSLVTPQRYPVADAAAGIIVDAAERADFSGDLVKEADFYFNFHLVLPGWAAHLTKTVTYLDHVFYTSQL